MEANAIDPVLRVVTPVAEGCADHILDLRSAVLRGENPGRCVRCYFSIYGKVADRQADRLLPLRRWLENHIEIVARDEDENELERLPIVLEDSETLQAFCERTMLEIRDNRVYRHQRIDLSFDYRRDRLAA